MKLILRTGAIEMAKDAYDWYEQRSLGLGDRFLESLESALFNIEHHPLHYGKIEGGYRQLKLKKFPYVIIYEIIENIVVVFAVFHESRNPELKKPLK